MGNKMFLTKNDIAKLPIKSFESHQSLSSAIYTYLGTSVSDETMGRIMADYKAGKIQLNK